MRLAGIAWLRCPRLQPDVPATSCWACATLWRMMARTVDESETPGGFWPRHRYMLLLSGAAMIAVWHAAPDVAAVRELAATIERLAKLHPVAPRMTQLRPLPSLPGRSRSPRVRGSGAQGE